MDGKRGDSPYKGPPTQRPDKRRREQERATRPVPDAGERRRERPVSPSGSEPESAPREPREQRLYGVNACLAMFAARPQDLRKVWLAESRLGTLKHAVAHCVKQRLGYTVVTDADLRRLSGSEHHEGVVFATAPAAEENLSNWLRDLAPGPQLAIWLDGVGNPHNLGAILRSAAHFGAGAVLLPRESELALSGAAARVAEGGAEAVPIVRLGRADNAFAQLSSAGFGIAATVVRGGTPLHAAKLPQRVVWVLGAEQLGVDAELAKRAAVRIQIPGTGAVDSLNVAAAAAVLLSEWWRQQGPRQG